MNFVPQGACDLDDAAPCGITADQARTSQEQVWILVGRTVLRNPVYALEMRRRRSAKDSLSDEVSPPLDKFAMIAMNNGCAARVAPDCFRSRAFLMDHGSAGAAVSEQSHSAKAQH